MHFCFRRALLLSVLRGEEEQWLVLDRVQSIFSYALDYEMRGFCSQVRQSLAAVLRWETA